MRNLRIPQAFWACLAACLLYSCSSREDLTQYVSSDYTVAAVANLENVLQNAGCTVSNDDGIQLSSQIKNVINSALSFRTAREVNDALSIKGVDLSQVIYVVTPHPYQLCIFRISDLKSFQGYLEELNKGEVPVTEEKGYTIYHADKQTAIFITNNTGFVLNAGNNLANVDTLEQLIENAKQNPLQEWQLEALQQGNALSACINIGRVAQFTKAYANIDLMQLPQTSICYGTESFMKSTSKINVWLDGLQLRAAVELVDSVGQTLENRLSTAMVDTSIMKYATDDDYLVGMAAIPGNLPLDSLFKANMEQLGTLSRSETEMVSNIMRHMSNIDGTIMVAAGPKSTGSIMSLEGWHIVLAAQLKKGMSQDYLQQIKELIEVSNQSMQQIAQQYASFGMSYKSKLIKYEESDSSLTITLPRGVGTIYAEAIGRDLVVSTSPISDNGGCDIAATMFQDVNSGLVIQMPRINPLSKFFTLPFGIDIESFSTPKEWTIMAEETDTEGLFLDNIFKALGGSNN